jgi:phosphate transport system substrate-binding protein
MKKNNIKIIPIVSILVLIAGVAGCNKREDSKPLPLNIIMAADPYLPVVQKQMDQYISLYHDVNIQAGSSSSREAIVNLLNDSVHCIIVDRKLNEEERQVAQQASIKVVENKIGEDGVAVIVNKRNTLPHFTAEDVKRILSRDLKSWKEFTGSDLTATIDLVLTGRNSGMYELLQKIIFSFKDPLEPTALVNNQEEVIKYVSMHPGSIGFVASSLVMNGDNRGKVRVVPVKVKSAEGKETDYLPGQQEIYSSLYPFHYSLYLYNTETNASIGLGFSAMVLSNIGQKIIQNAGLVPASIPYRTIQLTAE